MTVVFVILSRNVAWVSEPIKRHH